MEAVIGLVGVIVGASITWMQTWWTHKQEQEKSANYLAIRVVNTLRQYLYKCWLVAEDDGLSQGERDPDGCLVPQAKDPGPIHYPEDIDWKSIDSKLAYQLLTLPQMAESAERAIAGSIEFGSGPPDYEEVFEERHLQYSMIGLKVLFLESELCKVYKIPKENSLEEWDPSAAFQKTIQSIENAQIERTESQRKMMDELGNLTRGNK